MGISSDKQVKSYWKRPGHGYSKRNRRKQTEPILIAEQNNAIRTFIIKVKIENA